MDRFMNKERLAVLALFCIVTVTAIGFGVAFNGCGGGGTTSAGGSGNPSLSSNATLTALLLSQGTLTPVFSSSTFTYIATLPYVASTMTVTATVADATATIKVNNDAAVSGKASDLIALAVGANPVAIAVTAEDLFTRQTYTVTVTRVSSACGDSYVDGAAGEQCDTGGVDTAACYGAICKISLCGDGYVNTAAGEQCDTSGSDTVTCNGLTCKTPACGDGYVNLAAGEQCDAGGTSDNSTCNMSVSSGVKRCKAAHCGDGYVNVAAGEQCDSSGVDTATCNGATCTVTVCGDGIVNLAAGEQCDFGAGNSNAPGHCCTTACQLNPSFTQCP